MVYCGVGITPSSARLSTSENGQGAKNDGGVKDFPSSPCTFKETKISVKCYTWEV